ncbi:MAG: purine-binding chemotaxis protein CheW [Spirochaetes bacterium]|nr:purine-binding chemotaxis protein CheW [Spirochaetota bacterium]
MDGAKPGTDPVASASAGGGEEGAQYLTFKLGSEVYGINVEHVREVNEYGNLYPLPRVPEYIRGIINLRGEVVPVIDLSYRLYGKKGDVSKFTCIVIIALIHEGDEALLGIVIDAVKEVVEIKVDSIVSTPDFSLNIREDFVSGVGKVRDGFIVLLNVDTMLNIVELSKFGNDGDSVQIAV